MKKITNLLMMALLTIGMGLTSCDEQLDNAVNPGVMPVVDEDPSVTGVTTFSELQTALSAGKNVKLMNDIVCTAEIEITSDGALTIDGNGKKLSTTSAIRAFKVESSATVAFKNLTLTGFVSGGGPAINNSGTIVLDGCTIRNCHVNNTDGGGAIESSGKLYAVNTTFSGNYSGEIGGAINNFNGSLYMSGCTFTNNYTTKSDAYWGGAIGINGGSEVRLINCAFSGNKYGTATGPSDIGVFNKPTNYTIAGCTGATIASDDGVITPNTTGTATLNYSDLSNISFTYTAVPTASTLAESTVGMIVGSDGKAYTLDATHVLPSGVTAVAIVAYKGSATGEASPYNHGLAIAMKDAAAGGTVKWSSSENDESLDNYTDYSPAVTTAQSGLSNSQTSGFDNESNYPAFYAALHNTITVSDGISAAAPASGTSGWFLPSLYQWNKIVQGLSGKTADLSHGGNANANYTASSLNPKIEAAGGTGLQSGYYWPSTETKNTSAWYFNTSNGSVGYRNKTGESYVRAVFAF